MPLPGLAGHLSVVRARSAGNGCMAPALVVDAVHGVQYRALQNQGAAGWGVQWRPIRALRSFPTFSFISRRETFRTEREALDFMRRNIDAIVSKRI